MLSPIVIFAYNRPQHFRKTIESLKENELASESDLFIFADGPKENASHECLFNIKTTRNYIKEIEGFKSVTIELSERNKGLANSIIYGVTKIIEKYGKVIVLEDDMITSRFFLKYMNESLDLYEHDLEVACINGFCGINNTHIKQKTFFIKGADCWGWATWKRAWNYFNTDSEDLMQRITNNKKLEKDFTFNHTYPYVEMLQDQIDGKIDSWAIKWYASALISDMLCLYPTKSLIQNIGFDIGTHCSNSTDSKEASILADNATWEFPKIEIKESKQMRKEFTKLYKKEFKGNDPSIWKRIKRFIKRHTK